MKVFVYGSLMKGMGNEHFLSADRFVCEAVTQEEFRMVSFKYFPGIFRCEEGSPVVGEVYEVSTGTLAELDRLESNGTFYKRELVEIETKGDEPFATTAWIYILINNLPGSEIVPDSDWKNFYKRANSCAS